MRRQKIAAEFLGTAILVTLICGAIIIPDYGPSQAAATLTIASASGFAVAALVYAIGPISGCHINPAITICLWTAGRFPAREVPYYLVAQFLGGLAGAALVEALLHGKTGGANFALLSLAQTGWGASYSTTSAFIAETFATFVLSLIVLAVTAERTGTSIGAVAVGLAVAVLLITFMKVSGGSMNPARSFGPALLGGGEPLAQLWLYCVAPVLGGVLAALTDKLLHNTVGAPNEAHPAKKSTN
ncbi:aquaporin [Mesorhizobium caraganae]|uniref:MIP/aquaporin family protein n=1 Tax=Mesorhizobium caraganae TaxID=483206 RepID=UPI00193AAFD3|nr:aquaporin [Mesorhizobium caraganae]MBM2712964.1 aquaporin [Mesorhizobium caraganae]